MKKTTLLKSMLLLCALVVGSGSVWAADPSWSHTFASPEAISSSSITVNGATWTVATTAGKGSPTISAGNTNSKYGLKFGSSKDNYYGTVTFSTDYFKNYNVKSVTVKILNNGSKLGALSAQQNATSIGSTSQTFGQVWTDLTVNTNVGSGGSLSFTYAVEQAFYINSITVTYVVPTEDPSIDVTPSSRTVNYDAEEGTFTVTLNKIDTGTGTEVLFFEADGTTPATYDWFDADIDGDGNVAYTLTENTDPVNSRTAYFKVYGLAEESGDDVYSELITLTQSKYTVDFATLPFDFDGGKEELPTGMSHTGLGSNYDNSPKLKFDTTGDELILKIKGHLPQQLSFYIKGNGFSGGTFKVQWSVNGIDYTDLASYTSITDGNKEIDLSSCVNLRYIKWVYTEKSSGNVALGNIAVSQQTVAITPAKTYTTYVTTKALDFSAVSSDIKAYVAASVAAGTSITFTGKDAVPANIPLLIKAKTPGATVNVPVIASADAVGTNYLVAGTGSNVTYDESASHFYYILTNGEFKQANNSPVATTKAYLSLPSKVSANELTINFDDEAGDVTGIATVSSKKQNNGEYYNLNGQRVDASHKGIVIVNGKKFFNK